jgi:4-diphosphocytidyl-2-C-methyl-D-erythritol kinase
LVPAVLDRPDTLTVKAPAKINLALHVVGRRPDGYHLLESLAVFTEYGDTLSAAPAERDEIVVAGRYAAQVPINGANLVVKARDLMRGHFGEAAARPVAIRLEKVLPVASGIGGGSSDAAATLAMLAGFWNLGASEEELAGLGLRLGADVPMCLAARPLVARGIGEELERLGSFPALSIVLVNPGIPLATAQVFARLSSPENPGMPALDPAAKGTSILQWLQTTRNDLETPARELVPEIGDALAALSRNGAAVARMSGSGATCFGLFTSSAAAATAAAAIAAAHPAWFVSATASDAAGAADGR